ncbi:hypothetical protein OEA41_009552 [Lepraria neglecta]|uniref:Myb-like domain-containing protein n=1 Tax=Lepraria neglecta TaxID=209136 RepID=A0AAD9Z3B6_9LECA|nr:hypothetical protein OEA41_009552 [Lepraria neglecta]
MSLDQYYGSSGVDVIYPSQMMNPHQFSEPGWNPSSLLSTPSFSGRRTFPPRSPGPLHPHDYDTSYSSPHIPPPIQVSHMPPHVVPFSRPKSSPSTFGPNVEDLLFTDNPYRIKHEDYGQPIFSMSPQPLPSSSKAPPSPFYGAEYAVSNPSASPGRQAPIPIAPDPVGLRQMNALKRMREDEESSEYGQKKRKRAPSTSGPVELNEEEQLLLKLKEDENLPWKDIAVRFQTDLGKSYQVPALQMRFKRLRERMRTWTETDVQALEQAYDYWEKFQFDIIAAKVSLASPAKFLKPKPNPKI